MEIFLQRYYFNSGMGIDKLSILTLDQKKSLTYGKHPVQLRLSSFILLTTYLNIYYLKILFDHGGQSNIKKI